MPSSCSIVMLGRDTELLQSRAWVLARSGYRVAVLRNLENLEEAMAATFCDLLLFCHSLSAADCLRALFLAKWYQPGVLAVALEAGGTVHPVALPIEVVNTQVGPHGSLRR